jgi:hypothetical protein
VINKAKQVGTKVLGEDAFYTLVESSAPQKVEFALPPKASASKGKAKAMANLFISHFSFITVCILYFLFLPPKLATKRSSKITTASFHGDSGAQRDFIPRRENPSDPSTRWCLFCSRRFKLEMYEQVRLVNLNECWN